MKNLRNVLILLCVSLIFSACASSSSGKIKKENYANDFFGLAIKSADHSENFEILGYGENGVKYKFKESKMDKRIIAYARIERVKDENILWLGIQNNGNVPLIINEDKDHLYLELAGGETVEIPAGDFKYVDRKKRIKKDENQQIKVTLSGQLAHLTAGDIGAITFSIASNIPEIIVLKQLPDKEKQMMSVDLPVD